MNRLATAAWTSGLLGLAGTGTAFAQVAPEPTLPDPDPDIDLRNTDSTAPADVDVDVYTPDPVTPLSTVGIALAAGGGAGGFTDDHMRDTADTGGDWDLRVTIGTRSRIAFEGSYIGSAQAIDALGLDSDAVLVGNGLQGAVRLNATVDEAIQPFVFAGIGWRRYDVTNTDTSLSDVAGSDDVFEIPMGAGIAASWNGFILDARGELRATNAEDLLPEERDPDDAAEMHRWGVKATLGVEL